MSSGEISDMGVVEVTVYVAGVPRKMLVDTKVPVTHSGKTLFSAPNKKIKNLWPQILEKIWSKLNVNYERTCAGWQHESVRVFTGSGAKDYITSNLEMEKVWELLYDANKQGHMMGAGTNGEGDH